MKTARESPTAEAGEAGEASEAGMAAEDLARLADLVTPMAVRVAATLGIADHIANGVTSVRDLAVQVNANEDALGRLLEHLVSKEVLTRDRPGHLGLTATGAVLCTGHPRDERTKLDITGMMGRAELSFVHLLHSVSTGEPAFPSQFGRSFWDDLAADPHRAGSFNAQMGRTAAAWAEKIASAYDWGSLGHVVDAGGGDGTLLIAMLSRHSGMRGTVFELAAAADAARRNIAAAALTDRATVVTGSFFDPLPRPADGYVLSAVLHCCDDRSAGVILRRCAEAAAATDPPGAVFVIERTGPLGESVSSDMNLRVMTLFGGRERSAAEISALAKEAGLINSTVYPADDLAVIKLTAGR